MSPEKLQKQREYRARTGNKDTKKYEKTKKGFLMRAYHNMVSRISGVQKVKYHLYEGKDLEISKEEFYTWAMSSPIFEALWEAYVASGYELRLAPSVDRKLSDRGYTFDNVEWVTQSENSRRGAISQWGNK